MPAVRVIPCLDVAAGKVVKGVNFQRLRDIGDPIELASRYYQEGADEVTFLDVHATSENRKTMLDVVTKCAERVFIPLTVGGGISSLADVTSLLAAGADKVSVGSAGIANPALLGEIVREHGSQVLVISLDLKRASRPSGFGVTSHGGKRLTEMDALEWIRQVEDLGAGELLLNSIDADGTKSGFDIELVELIKSHSSLPVIASGGAGKVEDFVKAARSGADAVLAASVFHEGEISIGEVKRALDQASVEVRL